MTFRLEGGHFAPAPATLHTWKAHPVNGATFATYHTSRYILVLYFIGTLSVPTLSPLHHTHLSFHYSPPSLNWPSSSTLSFQTKTPKTQLPDLQFPPKPRPLATSYLPPLSLPSPLTNLTYNCTF